MIKWFKSLFAWHIVKSTGVWTYFENAITGHRKAEWSGSGYQPLDRLFIRPGDIVIGPIGRGPIVDAPQLNEVHNPNANKHLVITLGLTQAINGFLDSYFREDITPMERATCCHDIVVMINRLNKEGVQ